MRTRFAVFALAAAGVALVGAGYALLDYLGRDLVTDALGPIATITGEPSQPVPDEPSTQHEAPYFPVPPPLDDERVVDALGPIANVACHDEDRPAPATHVPDRSRLDGLDAPLGSISAACIALEASHS
ncbi:MAG: hypothetical protein ACM3JC_05410 [Rudaea sp.]